MQEGFGFQTFADGNEYIGYYQSDKKHGYGIYQWTSDGKRYAGWWTEGKQDGYGMLMREIGEQEFEVKYGFWIKGKRDRWLS